jgi:16S rRNA (adenine1518-N6/adenine1519-N6)-dimethyltransferase
MSILGISAQVFADVMLGNVVSAEMFTPPPKVDSQVIILKTRQTSFFADAGVNELDFFRTVKAGFSAKRKMLRSSLSGGLKLSKSEVEIILEKANIDPSARAETLDLDAWVRLTCILCYNSI